MLVLTRGVGQEIRISLGGPAADGSRGPDVRITVERIGRGQVRLGIHAPQEIHVLRGELAPREKPQAA